MSMIDSWLLQGVEEAIPKIQTLAMGKVRLQESVPSLRDINEFSGLVGGEECHVCAVGMTLMERAPLKLLIIMDAETRTRIAAVTIGEKLAKEVPMANSLLMEIGNIFGSAIANCLSRYLGSSVRTSVPEIVEDMAGAIVGSVLSSLGEVGDDILVLETTLLVGEHCATCGFYIFATPELNNVLLDTMKGKTE